MSWSWYGWAIVISLRCINPAGGFGTCDRSQAQSLGCSPIYVGMMSQWFSCHIYIYYIYTHLNLMNLIALEKQHHSWDLFQLSEMPNFAIFKLESLRSTSPSSIVRGLGTVRTELGTEYCCLESSYPKWPTKEGSLHIYHLDTSEREIWPYCCKNNSWTKVWVGEDPSAEWYIPSVVDTPPWAAKW